MASLTQRIDETWADLSPQEQRAAEFMRGHLSDLAVYNATEVAGLSGVSKATLSRLYRRLGFDGADDLRDHLRAARRVGTPVAASATVSQHLEREIANLHVALSGLDLAVPTALITNARRVTVIGFRNSYPVALHLRQQLAQSRDRVELAPLPGQTLGEELAALTPTDVVVLVGFRRRLASFAAQVDTLSAGPARVLLLTDAGGRRYRDRVDALIECPVDSVGGFDSYAAVSSIVSLLASEVLATLQPAGAERIAAIGGDYAALGELEGA